MRFAAYRHVGHRRVQGYTESSAIGLLQAVDQYQRKAGIGGPIAEIGVHHGQLFIAMKLLQQPDEAAVAIDLFEDQHAHIDKSGQGDRDRFLRHLDQWTDRTGLVIHQGDSTQITPGDIPAMSGVRVFSVDGGHTQEIVLSDMRLAEKSLVDGGVVIADDVFNQQWPGVCVGTVHYLEQGGALVPFYIGYNKVLFTQPEHAASYRRALDAVYADKTMTAIFESTFVGHPVSILVPVPKHPIHIARRNAALRNTYRKVAALIK
jgi:hypothetical protein